MEIKILYKEYPRNLNNKLNYLYFTLDEKKFKLPIVYIKYLKRNAFLVDGALNEFEKYVEEHYDCNIEKVKSYILYQLYNYSKGKGLNPVNYWDLKYVKRKEQI